MIGEAVEVHTVGELRKALKGIPASRLLTCDQNDVVVISQWDVEKDENFGCDHPVRKYLDISADTGFLE
jgi:hypothetical protein